MRTAQLKEKYMSWLPHLVVMAIILLIPALPYSDSTDWLAFWRSRYYLQMAFMITAFYLNYAYLTPQFFLQNRKKVFFLLIIISVFLLMIAFDFAMNHLPIDIPEYVGSHKRPNRNPIIKLLGVDPKYFLGFMMFSIMMGFSTGMAVLNHFKKIKLEQKEMEKAQQETELAFLRNQISPHFFFNALNNIYALVSINGDEAQKAIEKLSGLMRYLIYDSDNKKVHISKEINFLQNYIDLMAQRVNKKVDISVDIQKTTKDFSVPPLLFIPFVENAFKHGVSYRDASFIKVFMKCEENQIVFNCVNSAHPQEKKKEASSGLGIHNIKRRLDLLYGSKAKLEILDDDTCYDVKLNIPLSYDEHE